MQQEHLSMISLWNFMMLRLSWPCFQDILWWGLTDILYVKVHPSKDSHSTPNHQSSPLRPWQELYVPTLWIRSPRHVTKEWNTVEFLWFPFRNEEFLVYPSLKLNSSLLKIDENPKFKVIFQLSTQPSIFKCCFLFQGAYQFYDPNLWIVAIRVKVPMQSKPPSIMAPGRPRLVWTRAHAGCHKSQGTAWGKTNTPCP